MPTIAKRIKEIREARKMSQAELAKKINVSSVAVWQYENQENKTPSLKKLKKISEVLNISGDYLMGCEQKTSNAEEVLHRNLKKLSPKSMEMIQSMVQMLSEKKKSKSRKK